MIRLPSLCRPFGPKTIVQGLAIFSAIVALGAMHLAQSRIAVAQEVTPTATGAASASDPTRPLSVDHSLDGYRLVWHDEFKGDALNTDLWDYRTDSKMWSTQSPANVSVSDGALHLACKHESSNGKSYTGGGIISKREFQYGYYESSFRVPPGSGWHTSFWAMLFDNKGNTRPARTQEIDFCEQDSVNLDKYSAGVIAWGDKGKGFGREYLHPELASGNLSTDFHVWGCEFTPQTVRFYFDGKLTHETSAEQFKQGPQSIWLTCIASPLGHTTYVDDKKLPATADYKYVRFFQLPGDENHVATSSTEAPTKKE